MEMERKFSVRAVQLRSPGFRRGGLREPGTGDRPPRAHLGEAGKGGPHRAQIQHGAYECGSFRGPPSRTRRRCCLPRRPSGSCGNGPQRRLSPPIRSAGTHPGPRRTTSIIFRCSRNSTSITRSRIIPPFAEYDVPGGGCMFQRYTLSRCFSEADEVVSVAKLKNHLFMGVTLCTKNLFGLTPTIPPEGRVRSYFHHAIRLSYVLPDLARITNPCLNIVDATTGQWGREWDGEGRVCNALIAGDQIIATDAVGHEPDGARSRVRLADAAIPSRPQPSPRCRAEWFRYGQSR